MSDSTLVSVLPPATTFRLPWLVGCNFTPSTAINQLEMWQPETFDPQTIDRELGWAATVGFNSVRVFLHDLLFLSEGERFLDRFERVLDIAERHDIGVMPVFFDSVWHPFPRLGPQRDPEPGVHNSFWLQSPGVEALRDPACFARREDYVTRTVERFARDSRVQVWDLWNEPDNPNVASYGPRDLGTSKEQVVLPLLEQAFAWARNAGPTQPLTSAIWLGDWSDHETLKPLEKLQVECSDVVSFHHYGPADDLRRRIQQLSRYDRPLLCTEYMARGVRSTFEDCLPVLKEHRVGAYCWGLVRGRSQTHLPWDSWQHPYARAEPETWFHDIFHPDGSPYRASEAELLRKLCVSA
jgi:hypothetical protein